MSSSFSGQTQKATAEALSKLGNKLMNKLGQRYGNPSSLAWQRVDWAQSYRQRPCNGWGMETTVDAAVYIGALVRNSDAVPPPTIKDPTDGVGPRKSLNLLLRGGGCGV